MGNRQSSYWRQACIDTGHLNAVCNETMKCNNRNIKGMLCYTSKLQITRLQQSAAH